MELARGQCLKQLIHHKNPSNASEEYLPMAQSNLGIKGEINYIVYEFILGSQRSVLSGAMALRTGSAEGPRRAENEERG